MGRSRSETDDAGMNAPELSLVVTSFSCQTPAADIVCFWLLAVAM